MRRGALVLGLVVIPFLFACGGGGGSKKRKTPNTAPNLVPIASPQNAPPSSTLAITVTATDAENDPLVLSATPLPTNAAFLDNGNGTGDFSFTPAVSQLGSSFVITFGVDDGTAALVTQDVQIDVSSMGTGMFVEVTPPVIFADEQTWGMDSGDVNADGFSDIVAANYTNNSGTGTPGFIVLLGDGAGVFAPTVESPYALPGASANPLPRHLKLGDFNGDGVLDVVIAARTDGDLHVFLGDAPGSVADGTFTSYAPGFVDLLTDEVHHIASGDIDGDTNLDIAVSSMGDPTLRVFLGDGNGAFTITAQSPYDTSGGTGGIVHTAIADVNRDGIPDLIGSNFVDDSFAVWLGDNDGFGRNGNATFTAPAPPAATPVISPGIPIVADFDRAGGLDVALPHFSTPAEMSIWLGDLAGMFTVSTGQALMGSMAEYGATGDFNGDGNPDLAGGCTSTADMWVFFGDGTGGFTGSAANPHLLSGQARYVLADDFNNDGVTDLGVAVQTPGVLHIFLGI